MRPTLYWALPGVVFAAAYGLSAWVGAASSPPAPRAIVAQDPDSPCPMLDLKREPRPDEADVARVGAPLAVPDSRLHGCQKLSYAALGAFLGARGVNMASTTANSTGALYKSAADTFGVPKPESRLNERSFHTTASATKLFDIFLQAAPEIIASIADPAEAPACVLDGQSQPMFDASGQCVEASVSCVLARPATADDMTLCNLIVDEANPSDPDDVDMKRRIAVATLLSAGHTCE